MKKYISRALSLLILSVCLLSLFSCGGADYRDDVAVSAIDSAIRAKVPVADGYYAADSDYLEFYFEGADAIVTEYIVAFSATSTNINQFGIFHVKDGEAEAMAAMCESYIVTMKDRWVAQANYIASEHPKMEGAEVRIFGNYVVYAMLTEADKATAFAEVEALLAQ